MFQRMLLVLLLMLAAIGSAVSLCYADASVPDASVVVDSGAKSSIVVDAGDAPTVSEVSVVETSKSIFDGFKNGEYRIAISGIIVMLMFLWRKFLSGLLIGKLSGWWLGFVNALLALIGSVPEALMMEPFKWTTFLWATFITSAQAMFFWQMVLKKIPGFNVKKE